MWIVCTELILFCSTVSHFETKKGFGLFCEFALLHLAVHLDMSQFSVWGGVMEQDMHMCNRHNFVKRSLLQKTCLGALVGCFPMLKAVLLLLDLHLTSPTSPFCCSNVLLLAAAKYNFAASKTAPNDLSQSHHWSTILCYKLRIPKAAPPPTNYCHWTFFHNAWHSPAAKLSFIKTLNQKAGEKSVSLLNTCNLMCSRCTNYMNTHV